MVALRSALEAQVASPRRGCGLQQLHLWDNAYNAPGRTDWADTAVYVGTERWGRGLDLELEYVFLLAPPTSSATYAHLAGRTARKGQQGTAITILSSSQAPRLVAFSEALGVSFQPI